MLHAPVSFVEALIEVDAPHHGLRYLDTAPLQHVAERVDVGPVTVRGAHAVIDEPRAPGACLGDILYVQEQCPVRSVVTRDDSDGVAVIAGHHGVSAHVEVSRPEGDRNGSSACRREWPAGAAHWL